MSGESAEVGIHQVLIEQHVDDGEQQCPVAAGARRDVAVGDFGGPGAVRVDDGQSAAAALEVFELAGEVGHRGHTSVGDQRIGPYDHQVIGALDVGHGERQRAAVEVAAGDVLGHLIQRAGGVDVSGLECAYQLRCVQRTGDGVRVGISQIHPHRGAAGGRGDPLQSLDGGGQRLIPTRLDQLAVAADQGDTQPVGIVVQLGEAGALRADEPMAEDVVAVAAGTGDPAVVDGEDQPAGCLAERTDTQCGTGHLSRHLSYCAAPVPGWQGSAGRGGRR